MTSTQSQIARQRWLSVFCLAILALAIMSASAGPLPEGPYGPGDTEEIEGTLTEFELAEIHGYGSVQVVIDESHVLVWGGNRREDQAANIFDLNTQTSIATKRSPNQTTSGGIGVVINGDVFIWGGHLYSNDRVSALRGAIYSIDGGTWQTTSSSPYTLGRATAALIDGRALIVGYGPQNSPGPHKSAMIYSPGDDTWSEIPAGFTPTVVTANPGGEKALLAGRLSDSQVGWLRETDWVVAVFDADGDRISRIGEAITADWVLPFYSGDEVQVLVSQADVLRAFSLEAGHWVEDASSSRAGESFKWEPNWVATDPATGTIYLASYRALVGFDARTNTFSSRPFEGRFGNGVWINGGLASFDPPGGWRLIPSSD